MSTIMRSFDGHPVATITYKGRPCWLAGQVGEALGYKRGGLRFVNQVTTEWAHDLIEGTDYLRIEGKDLADLKAGLHTGTVSGHASHVTLLFESGIHLALMKTSKPAGQKMRRWLAEEVLPQIQRTGQYAPAGTLPAQPAVPALAAGRKIVVTGRVICVHGGAVVVQGEDAQRGGWLMRLPPSLARGARDDDPPSRVEVVLRIEAVRLRRGRVEAEEVVTI